MIRRWISASHQLVAFALQKSAGDAKRVVVISSHVNLAYRRKPRRLFKLEATGEVWQDSAGHVAIHN